jgi:CRISPR-associated endonuclease/helicase Cas3
MSLSTDDFEHFHHAVHGYSPFPWQSRLLRKVVAEQRWPRVLDLPTGCGKTTCIDIALFALALDAERQPVERSCARRIAMVVDRRVVVDQAAERGRKLLHALEAARAHEPGEPAPDVSLGGKQRTLTDGDIDILRRVSDALASLSRAGSAGEPPLAVFTLRGGIPKDDGWAHTPDQPLVIASTVDQIGSRLLMHGYGVSPGMRPVHAGLAGNDTLILLDEVHLSQPFKQTLERLGALRERFDGNGLPRRFQFAFLSATPGEDNGESFRLSDEELDPRSAIGPRLHARKSARIVKVSGRQEVAARIATEALGLLERHTVVAAVVNRVDTALGVFAALEARLGEDVVLLTGRMRPLDRDDVLARYRPRIATGERKRAADERKFVVVGTQCIEAGADFDFDAMVTESASFDALRQRFGRVDRLGEYRDTAGEGKAEGVIVHDKDVKDDPIYGETIAATIKWLDAQVDRKMKTVDFGSRSLQGAPDELLAPKTDAPTLLPAYLDLWSQTAPEPFEIPEPGLFLHGPRSGPEEVQVVWRTDIDDAAFTGQDQANIIGAVGAVPPSSLEAISLPFTVARKWLAQQEGALDRAADVEIKDDGSARVESRGRRALRWRGEQSEIVEASRIKPGDTIVVPSKYGGIDEASRCFDPRSPNAVPDLAERAALIGRGHPLLRLHPRVLDGLGLGVDPTEPGWARNALGALADDLSGWKRPWSEALAKGRQQHVVQWNGEENDGWVVLEGKRVKARRLRRMLGDEARNHASLEDGAEFTTDDEDSPYLGGEVTLETHTRDVEACVHDYAQRLGLSKELASALSLAAWLHDIGKADRRFQRLLRGGSEIAYLRDENRILAKSAMGIGSIAEHRRAQRLSGYPRGTRHEVQSLAMIEAGRDQLAGKTGDIDLDLVLHLVASHHGHCRPFAPPTEDSAPIDVRLEGLASNGLGTLSFAATSAHGLHRLDSPLADRFWALTAKYGWLELCWLEAILRLADHRASEAEAGGQE